MPDLPAKFRPYTTANKTITPRMRERQYGDGYKQIAPDGINPAKIDWEVSFVALPLADGNELENFFANLNDVTGRYIQWTDPTGVYGDWILEGPIRREMLNTATGVSTISVKLCKYFSI